MTNKEAIKYLIAPIATSTEPSAEYLKQKEAYDLAIKALERDGSLSYNEVITSVFSCPVCGAIWRDKAVQNDYE